MTPNGDLYYAGHSAESDPQDLRRLLDSLPKDPKGILEAVGGLVLHKAFVDPAKCGVSSLGISGGWFVAASVIRDLAALNKREMLPWDQWGIARDMGPGITLPEVTAARIDSLARLIANPDLEWKTLRETYDHDDELKVPAVVLSFPKDIPIEMAVDG